MTARTLLLLLLLGPAAGSAAADTLRVAVAANFREAFEMVAELYEQQGGARTEGIYGSSGMLYAQANQGAPFALFLSADMERPERLAAAGRTAGPVQVYARGRLVLWMPGKTASPDLLNGRRFAMANPQLAPYGAAARACLEHLGLWGVNAGSAIYGNNVAQAFHFVVSKAVPAGFVAYSQVLSRQVPAAEIWLAPPECHPPIEQGAVVLSGEQAESAQAFLSFLLSEPVQVQLEPLGYGRP
jgi:molybdenum ABC transporter molybdate-binding protein